VIRHRETGPVDVLAEAEDLLAARLLALPWLDHAQAAELGDALADVFQELRERFGVAGSAMDRIDLEEDRP